MAGDGPQHPILVDTDALIAVANSPLWNHITENIGLTTTNVCQHELERHREENRSGAPEGSRPHRLHHGSARVLAALEDDATSLARVVSVPRPHGTAAGERSLEQQLVHHPDAVDFVVLKNTLRKYGMKEHPTSQPGARRIYEPSRDSVAPYQPS